MTDLPKALPLPAQAAWGGVSRLGMFALYRPGPLDALDGRGKAWEPVTSLRHVKALSGTPPVWRRKQKSMASLPCWSVVLWGTAFELWKKCLCVLLSCNMVFRYNLLSWSRVNALIRPVLKHGPRSLTCMRVVGWKTWRRNESKGRLGLLWWEPFSCLFY